MSETEHWAEKFCDICDETTTHAYLCEPCDKDMQTAMVSQANRIAVLEAERADMLNCIVLSILRPMGVVHDDAHRV